MRLKQEDLELFKKAASRADRTLSSWVEISLLKEATTELCDEEI